MASRYARLVLRAPRYVLAWAGACVAAFVAVMAVAYYLPEARHIDRTALMDFGSVHNVIVVGAANAFSRICDPIEYTVLVGLVLFLVYRARGPRVTAASVFLLLGAVGSAEVLKPMLAYLRDPHPPGHHLVSAASFPSGHAAASMSLAAVVVIAAPRTHRMLAAVLGALFTLAVSFSILVLEWHYPSDVLGGYLLATSWCLVTLAALRTAAERWPDAHAIGAAARQAVALADWRVVLGTLLVGALFFAAVALTRITELTTYARDHTAFVVVVSAIAMSAAVLLAGVAALSSRRAE